MQGSAFSVGASIEARCTKCRKVTDHTIVAMDDAGPTKLQCNSCSRQHKYRTDAAVKKPVVRGSVNRTDAERREWAVLRPSMDSAQAKDYSMTAAYKVKALINHSVFGLGIVQRVLGSQKVAVLFEDGQKTMRCK